MIPKEKIEAGILARVRKHPRKGYLIFRYPHGPWNTEPDFLTWTTESGLVGQVLRHHELGTLAGYVQIPDGHPWHGRPYDDVEANAHGSLNFSARDADGLWWIGFDCAHYRDLIPLMGAFRGRYAELQRSLRSISERLTGKALVYRDFSYVRSEVEDLARQVVEAAH